MHAKFIKFVFELDTDLKGGLASEGAVDSIRFLMLDDFSHKVRIDGKEVHLVCKALRSLYGCNVGIDQYCVDAFFLQCFDSLASGVIEFSGLTNTQSATAEDKDFLD